jgi:small conductance mechanosensitive channel
MAVNLDRLGSLLVVYGINVVGALLVAALGWWAAGFAARAARRMLLASGHMDPTVAGFISSLARHGVLVVAFLVILQLIGIQATSLVAVLGAASLAIGLALQGTLANMAAGVMLLLFRPFRVGDGVEVAGKTGTVKDLNLFMTELASGDNVKVLIPNGLVWGATLTNLSAYPIRRVGITFLVELGAEVERIIREIGGFLASNPRVLRDPAPSVAVSNITEKAFEISVQAWSKAEDSGALRGEIMARLPAAIRPTEPRKQAGY